MVDLNPLRKNKINLDDYDYKQDIENRLLMAEFTSTDLEILEEILYSSIKIPIKKLAKSLDLVESEIIPSLEKLSKTGLFTFEDDSIVVDKEMRKYFEAQILKFEPDFKPGMEYLQNLLKKVPIHLLPIWYSIPRTSNNIFDSLVEKYLLTPQIFQRYLMEVTFTDPILSQIVEAVYQSPEMKVYGKDLIEKFKLSKEYFEECMLYLEFHFICCLGYEKNGKKWEEVVLPFYEWKEYTDHMSNTVSISIPNQEAVQRYRPDDFSFIDDITQILSLVKKQPLNILSAKDKKVVFTPESLALISSKIKEWNGDEGYLNRLIAKTRLLKLADIVDDRLYALEGASDWFEMRPESRAIFLYRHPLNRLTSHNIPPDLLTDRNLRESEKSIVRVLDKGWVYFDDFITGVIAPLSEDSVIVLKKQGKTWKYNLPAYTEEELALIKAVVLNWLFEVGVTSIGKADGRDCFCATSFGQSLFGR